MTKRKIFIDGEAGTTGLHIAARLGARDDIALVQIDPARRKDPAARRAALNDCDIAILCLPDEAAREAVAMVENTTTRIIDASTAHRTAANWAYGFPEYDKHQRERLRGAMRIANPGCYAIAAIAILHPLVSSGLVPTDWPVSINGVSGYSGGGKALIAAFEDAAAGGSAPGRVVYDYALGLGHKHVPEITHWVGLTHAPLFLPAVARYYKGMLVHVPLPLWALPGRPSPREIHQALAAHYAAEVFVHVAPFDRDAAQAELDPEALNDSNDLHLHVLHNAAADQVIVVGQLDNLGKGASGQVVQTVNVLLGVAETRGL